MIEEKTDSKVELLQTNPEAPPIKPQVSHPHYRDGKAYYYYRSLEGKFRGWWEEFAHSVDDRGKLEYKNLRQFIKTRTKNEFQRQVLYELLGPTPEIEDNKKLRVPSLGDWDERRKMGSHNFEDLGKVRALNLAIKNHEKAVEAAREIAPLLARHIARCEKVAELIDEAFSGRPLNPELPPDDPRNKVRSDFYLKMHKQVNEQEALFFREWYRCHGLEYRSHGLDPIERGYVNAKNHKKSTPR